MKDAVKQTAKRLAGAVGIRRPPSAQQRAIEEDVAAFDRRYRAILSQSPQCDKQLGDAIIISLHSHAPTLKTEGCLCKALQAQGMRIRPLIHRDDRLAKSVYKTFGIGDFLCWEDFLDPKTRSPHTAAVDTHLNANPSFDNSLAFSFRGSVLGEHALSWVVRQQHAGQIDLEADATRAMFRDALIDGMQATDAAHRLFDEVDAKLVLFCERGYTPFGDLFDVALSRSLNVVQWLGSHIDHALHAKRYTHDTRTAHPISLHPRTWEGVKQMRLPDDAAFLQDFRGKYETGDYNNRHNLQKNKRILKRDALIEQLGLDASKKTAVIFSHILWDATFFYGKGLFPDYAQWLVETVRAACGNDKVNWLVKLHPVNVWRLGLDGFTGELAEHILLREAIGALPEHIKLIEPETEINTASMWGAIDYALTVRGTVGMELAMFGTTVLTAGTGRYAGMGFTLDSDTREQYLERLATIEQLPAMTDQQVALARRHAQGIFALRPLPFRSFTLSYPHGEVPTFLHPRVEIGAKTIDGFVAGDDMQRFAQWCCHSDEPDLLGGLAQ